jgi:hypothetical protein
LENFWLNLISITLLLLLLIINFLIIMMMVDLRAELIMVYKD